VFPLLRENFARDLINRNMDPFHEDYSMHMSAYWSIINWGNWLQSLIYEDAMRTLDDLLRAANGQVDRQKLIQLREKLEAAVGADLSTILVADPIKIRRQLVIHLQSRAMSRGMVQSFEQLFMGVIRRAALLGLVETPPEGPWSLKWQRVLDKECSHRGAKSALRSLAAWATAKDFDPDSISGSALKEWAAGFSPSRSHVLVHEIREMINMVGAHSKNDGIARQQRLVLKASVGSVRTIEKVYGLEQRSIANSKTRDDCDDL
jgi:hypothetical protein